MAGVEEEVLSILVTEFGADQETLNAQTRLVEDLGFDEFVLVEFTGSLSETFGIAIPDEDADQWRTVGDVITYVVGRVGGGG